MASKKKAPKPKSRVAKSKPKKKPIHFRSSIDGDGHGHRELVKQERRGIIVPLPAKVTPVSMQFDPNLDYAEWSPALKATAKARDASNWWVGDGLNYGEMIYGETYAQAASETGIPEDTLMILKHVASRVAPENRIKDLTWSHHREVAKFPAEEQSRWLKKAHQRGWSVRELRDALRKTSRKAGEKEGEEREEAEGPQTGEGCKCCGGSPAPLAICESCMETLEKVAEKAA